MQWENQLQDQQGSLFMVLTQADLCPKFPSQIRPLALLSDYQLCLLYSLFKCCWAIWLTGVLASLSGLTGLGAILSSGSGYDSAPLPGWGQTRLQGWQISLGPESGRSASCWVPWSDCTIDLVVQVTKAAGWDYYLEAAGRNSVWKIWVLIVASPSPLLHHNLIPSGRAPQILLQSLWGKIRVRTPKMWSTTLRQLDVHSGLSFPAGGTVGETSQCGAGPAWRGVKQTACGQSS